MMILLNQFIGQSVTFQSEKVLSSQLSAYFGKMFDEFLCAFREGHGWQTTLLRLLEDWNCALDNNAYSSAFFNGFIQRL